MCDWKNQGVFNDRNFVSAKVKSKVMEFMFGPVGDIFPPTINDRNGIIGE